MHWQTAETRQQTSPTVSHIVDLIFTIRCRSLPVDHHWLLKEALQQALPWLAEQTDIAVHPIHSAESGNGWIRPNSGIFHVSRRTRLCLRLPKNMLALGQQLEGKQLDIAGHPLTVNESHMRTLGKHKTLFARHLLDTHHQDESAFIADVLAALKEKGIIPPRIISGRSHPVKTPQATLTTRSVMLDGLNPVESIQLQATGIGKRQQLGIGIFLPHKSIDAVYTGNSDLK